MFVHAELYLQVPRWAPLRFPVLLFPERRYEPKHFFTFILWLKHCENTGRYIQFERRQPPD